MVLLKNLIKAAFKSMIIHWHKKAWVWWSCTFPFSVTCHDYQGLSLSFTITVGWRGYFMVSRKMGCFSFSFFPDHPLCCCCTNTGQFWVFLLFHIHIEVYMCNYFCYWQICDKQGHAYTVPCTSQSHRQWWCIWSFLDNTFAFRTVLTDKTVC